MQISHIYLLNGRKGKPLFVLIIMKREEHWRIQETEHMYTNPTRRGKKKSHINTIQAYMCVYTVYATKPTTNNTVCSIKSFNVDICLPLVAIDGLTGCLHNKCTHVYVTFSIARCRFPYQCFTLIVYRMHKHRRIPGCCTIHLNRNIFNGLWNRFKMTNINTNNVIE